MTPTMSTAAGRGETARSKWLWLVILAVVALVAAGCGGDDDDASNATPGGEATEEEAEGEPVTGGSLVYADFRESRGFDPIQSTNAGRAGDVAQYQAIFDSLIDEDVHTGELTPKMLESFESVDNLVWTLTLRPDIQFSDGTPLNAEAIKFNWERIGNPANQSANASGMLNVASLEVVDDLTLRATMLTADSQFPRTVARNLTRVASPTALQADPAGFSTNPVGAGPFLVQEWVRDDHLTLVRNPDYWQAPLPYLDELIIRQIPEDEARLNSLVAGEVLWTQSGPNPPLAQRAEDAGFALNPAVPAGGLNLWFNMTEPPFDDVRVRRALALSLNLDTLDQAVFGGTGQVPVTFFPETSPFYNPELELTGSSQDLEEAQALIDEYIAENGGPLQFTLNASSSPLVRVAFEYMQAQMNELEGVEAGYEVIESAQLQPRLGAGDFDVGSYAYSSIDGHLLIEWFSEGARQNWGHYSSPEMSEALTELRAATTDEERKPIFDTIQELMIEDVPVVFFSRFFQADMYDGDQVNGVSHYNTGPRWEEVWLTDAASGS